MIASQNTSIFIYRKLICIFCEMYKIRQEEKMGQQDNDYRNVFKDSESGSTRPDAQPKATSQISQSSW